MSTKVPTMHPDLHEGDAVYLGKFGDDGTHIGVNGNGMVYAAGVIVSRADFLAAVAVECDAIVIPRTDLPKVEQITERGDALFADYTRLADTNTRDGLWHALRWLAVDEYRKAHPPVDEAQVEALTRILHEPYPDCGTWGQNRTLARRLLATGRIEVRP